MFTGEHLNVTRSGPVSYYRCRSKGRCASAYNHAFSPDTLHGGYMRRALIAVAAMALLGCGGDSTGPAVSAVGTWNLQTVDNGPLPYTAVFVASPLYKLEILSDAFVVRADGSYT